MVDIVFMIWLFEMQPPSREGDWPLWLPASAVCMMFMTLKNLTGRSVDVLQIIVEF